MEHLEAGQLLDLDQVGQLGPLFDQSRTHLGECAQCRRAYLECEALKALALEASLASDKRLLRRALQAIHKVEVEERLMAEAGPDAAREILLEKNRAASATSLTPVYVGLLALLGLAGIYYYSRLSQAPELQASKQPLPFEFQDSTSSPSPGTGAETVMATPALPAEERAKDQELDGEARRLFLANLNKKSDDGDVAQERPTMIPETAVPTRAVATAAPTPQPAPSPTAIPAVTAEREDSTVDMRANAPLPTSDSNAASEPAPASLQIKNPHFSSLRGESAQFLLELPETGSVEIRVFDINGKSVKLVTDSVCPAGETNVAFAGTDESGASLPPGSYYARVMTRWFSRVEPLEILP